MTEPRGDTTAVLTDRKLERFDLLVRATNDVVRDWDVTVGTVHWSGSLSDTFGHDVPAGVEAGIEWWASRIHPDDRVGVVDSLRDVLATPVTAWSAMYRFRRRDGAWAHVLDRSYLVRNAQGAAMRVVGSMIDVTQAQRAEIAAGELNRELEVRVAERTRELAAAVRELESFAYSVSHDLRTPLRALEGFSLAVLEDYGDRLDDDGRDYLRRIRAGSKRMAGLIDDLLRLSRVSRAEWQQEPLDLASVARDVMADLASGGDAAGVEFIVPDTVPVFGDEPLLRVALFNLLQNACKFTRHSPAPRVEFGAARRGDAAEYFVADNGVGFDMAHAGKLFGAFQRMHRSDEFEGTGIGLATVQRIVHRHGGGIRAEAVPGRGATIYFTLSEGNPK